MTVHYTPLVDAPLIKVGSRPTVYVHDHPRCPGDMRLVITSRVVKLHASGFTTMNNTYEERKQ